MLLVNVEISMGYAGYGWTTTSKVPFPILQPHNLPFSKSRTQGEAKAKSDHPISIEMTKLKTVFLL